MIRSAVVAALAAVVLTGGASAEAAPDERAAAASFADAARVYTQEVWSGRPVLDTAIAADAPARTDCRAFDRIAPEDLSRRNAFRAFLLEYYRMTRPIYVLTVLPMERLVAALDATATRDPALRSARAVWRSQLGLFRLLASLPDDTCARVSAWVDSGARGRPLPEVDLRGLDDDSGTGGALDREGGRSRRLTCAAARLRELGQGPRRAWRITGESADRATFPAFLRLLMSDGDRGVSVAEIERLPVRPCR